MSAAIAVLVVIVVTLAAGLSAQVINSQSNYYAADQNVAEIAQNSSDEKPEPPRRAAQTDQGPLKKASKQKSNVCVENCPDIWRPYQLTPWPL